MFYMLLDGMNYSLVLEYADGGTLRNYLRTLLNGKTNYSLQKKLQVQFPGYKKVIHGDIVSIIIFHFSKRRIYYIA